MMGSVVVAGALGIVGSAVAAHERGRGREVIGLSRRAGSESDISVDLADASDCQAKLSGLRGVSHLVYAALYEKPDLGAGWLEADQIATNLAMLRNLLDALESAGLRHITLLQGAKAYGVHLGQIPVPAREDAPRHLHPNFYWEQEDLLRARQGQGGWCWTILRPQVVLGSAIGSAMNMIAAIGAYAAISRARGLPLIYPGQGHRVTEATDVRLLARAVAWAGESPAAADQIFNVTNGDVMVWQNVWPVVARLFGMEVGLPHPMPLATIMPGHEATWAALVAQLGLVPTTLAGLVGSSWQFADFAFSRTHSTASLLSTIKIRRAGFADCIDTEESLAFELRELQRKRILPP